MQAVQDWMYLVYLLHDAECVLDGAQMCILMAAVKAVLLCETPCNSTQCTRSCSVWCCGLCGILRKHCMAAKRLA